MLKQSDLNQDTDDGFDDDNNNVSANLELTHAQATSLDVANPRKKQKLNSMVPSFPSEIITNILCRLPVKDVLYCTSVSKTWCSIIHNPYFINMHFNYSMKIYSNRGLVPTCPSSLCKWICNNTINYSLGCIGFDFRCQYVEVLGSCHGLLAIFNSSTGKLALLNPFTRRYKMLPKLEIDDSQVRHNIYGFGYDPISHDYKFVRIIFIYQRDMKKLLSSGVHVYSLRDKSWTRVDDFPYELDTYCYVRISKGILFNNTLYWLLSPRTKRDAPNNMLIVAFDLVTEKFCVVPQPDYDNNNKEEFGVDLGTLGGKYLYLCCCSKNTIGELKWKWEINIWVMKKYSTCWIKLVTLPAVHSVAMSPKIEYWKNDNQILFSVSNNHMNLKLLLYDLETQSFKNYYVRRISDFRWKHICVESLVGLDHGDWEILRNKKKWTKKKYKRKMLSLRLREESVGTILFDQEHNFCNLTSYLLNALYF